MSVVIDSSYIKYLRSTLNKDYSARRLIDDCVIHKAINFQALNILFNDNLTDCYSFMFPYLKALNMGVSWADTKFKGLSHFYNPQINRGLPFLKHALTLSKKYYGLAQNNIKVNIDKALFFLGATAHIIQDMTVPQHASRKLFGNHYQFEKYIQDTYFYSKDFSACDRGEYNFSVEQYLKSNAIFALSTMIEYEKIEDHNHRYFEISKKIIPLAQRTTAGLFYEFYKEFLAFSK